MSARPRGAVDATALARMDVTYTDQFRYSGETAELPAGFVEYHQKNFSHYFDLDPEAFRGKTVLETGAGPGKHAAVLHRLGALVTAVDLLESNVEAINRLKAVHGLDRLVAVQADLMQPLAPELGTFNLISAHNWVQHSEHPGLVLQNLDTALKMGGRLYVSTYQAGTFRFFITQIARSVLCWNDREVVKQLIPFFFPAGFLEFRNPVICYENILDDFFVPHLGTFRQASLAWYLGQLGYDVLVPHRGHSRLWELDDEPLRMGFIKTLHRPSTAEPLEFRVDEFDVAHIHDADREIVDESVMWARRAIEALKRTGDEAAHVRAGFALGLYRLRATYSRSRTAQDRHVALRAYLQRFVTGDMTSIRAGMEARHHHRAPRAPQKKS